MLTTDEIQVQGRTLCGAELAGLQQWIYEHWEWSQNRLVHGLCQQWDWRTPTGQLKTFAGRSLLHKLEARYGLVLPPVRVAYRRARPWGLGPAGERPVGPTLPVGEVSGRLEAVQPLCWELALPGSAVRAQALRLLRQHHYLGCNRPVGTHLLYVVRTAQGREVAVHLVGAPAWQCAARDRSIGWSAEQRRAQLHRVANHSRFLIVPWARIPQLASHLLGELSGRLRRDWAAVHGVELALVESFVEEGRYEGTAYRAAHWVRVGWTRGRTRQEKGHAAVAPCKAVWVCPLGSEFRGPLGVH